MKILLLAPHPFYQERGTPIAVDLLLNALSRRGDEVDVLTYHEGEDRDYPGVTIHRISPVPRVKNIRPGFSLKKIVCDYYLWGKARDLVHNGKYDVIHAVEESGFIAMRLKKRYGIPYVFDMDSSMPEQMVEKNPLLKPFLAPMRKMERKIVRNADAVVAVCDSLAEIAAGYGGKNITLLNDISLLRVPSPDPPAKEEASLKFEGTVFMYIGNLELYQGIDLLLDSFTIARRDLSGIRLVIVGGIPSDISKYKTRAVDLGIDRYVEFLGPKPISMMKNLFATCDVLVSPRTKGNNTPMKIYSYLDSEKAVLATDLPTHTQVLTQETACLAAPDPNSFAAAMVRLAGDAALRQQLARNASKLVEKKYSFDVFENRVNDLYRQMEAVTRNQEPEVS